MNSQEIEKAVNFVKDELSGNREFRNKISHCPICNSNIKDREVALYKGLVRALHDVYLYCRHKGINEFETKDIKHLLDKNAYARFGDLVRFGGIVYKPKDANGKTRKAFYGINRERASAFFCGDYQIPVSITINQITNEIIDEKRVGIKDIPELIEYLDETLLYKQY